jgi:hypothetical protein
MQSPICTICACDFDMYPLSGQERRCDKVSLAERQQGQSAAELWYRKFCLVVNQFSSSNL